MKLHRLWLSNFQSFGSVATEINLEDTTFLIGPNGAGKTAILHALCRMFAFEPKLRRILKSDFHIPLSETEDKPKERSFWIETEFTFPELEAEVKDHATIPPNFSHMRLDTPDGVPRVRFRLDAIIDLDDEVEETLNYVLKLGSEDHAPIKHPVPRTNRNEIHIHYLPARRDPSDHITYTANSLLGRALRSVNWQNERVQIKELTEQISEGLIQNKAVGSLSKQITDKWKNLHRGNFFSEPHITFVSNEIETLLRHLSVSFSPGHGENLVDFSRLSDGQKSMLYLSLVLSLNGIGRSVLDGSNTSFDVDKLKPAIFTLIAMEEPENSLSPHYLGRVVQALTELGKKNDAQSILATHAPSILKRVEPKQIRYLRLDSSRQTQISTILMPPTTDEAYKFVREAVQAFPELYFSRLVILGEGDSEEIVLPRLFKAKGLGVDETAISVVPLGGRHVNHFWRLLEALDIPFLTLLDLDLARYQGGWGRVRYVAIQLRKFSPNTCGISQKDIDSLSSWNSPTQILEQEKTIAPLGSLQWLAFLENGGIFFSSPLDLDFSMLKKFPEEYCVEVADQIAPDDAKIKSVLGDSFHDKDQYTEDEQKLFITYHKRFKTKSKPAAHLDALSRMDDATLAKNAPDSMLRLIDAAIEKLESLPE